MTTEAGCLNDATNTSRTIAPRRRGLLLAGALTVTLVATTACAAKQDVDRFLRSVEQLAASNTQVSRDAFSQAPSCAQLSARPAPTS